MSDLSKGVAFVDNQYVPIHEAKISILDWGFLHSDATYDVAHVWDGKFFRLDDHLDRFYNGMQKLHMQIPHSKDELKAIMSECVKRSGLKQAYVEIITTRGTPQAGSRDPRNCTNNFFAFAIPFVWICKEDQGLHLIVSSQQRIPSTSVDPMVKNYHWLDLVMGQYEAFDRGGETAALVDSHGNITEGPGFNIFAVKDNVLTTPAKGVLEGVTRKTVIELAQAKGYQMNIADLSPDDARAADEMFATSTAGGVMAITKIDDQVLGDGNTGNITKQLQQSYWALHQVEKHSSVIDY